MEGLPSIRTVHVEAIILAITWLTIDMVVGVFHQVGKLVIAEEDFTLKLTIAPQVKKEGIPKRR